MPPAVLLPQLRTDLKKSVRYPTAPSNPPTNNDVANSVILTQEVYAARRKSLLPLLV